MPLVTTTILKAGILAKGLLTWVLGGGVEAAEGVAGDLLENFVDTLLRRAPDPLRAALAAAEADILACNSYQGLQVKEWPWVRDTAFTLLRRHNPTAEQVTSQNYDPDTLADTLMEGAGDLLSRFDNQPHQKQACHDVLRILLRHLLNQGDHLTEMEAAWRGEILSRLSEILQRLNDLPNEVALRHLAGLSLLRPNAPEPFKKRRSANILLTARHTDLPLRGRDTEMDDLWQWATSRREVAVRLLIGPGGHGKTRLALELCRRLERAGWRTGFAVDQWPTLSDVELARIMPPDRPTLIVLDYAAGRGSVLSALARLASGWPEKPAFRLLLIEREAGDWWANCRSLIGPAGELFADPQICEREAMRIRPLPEGGPAEIYADAVAAFATLLRRDSATATPPADWPADLRLPLFARARALLAVEATETGGLSADDILDRLITREEGLWRRELYGDSADNNRADSVELPLMRLALTLITLSGPTPVGDVPALLCRLPRLADHDIAMRERLLAALHPLYGDGDLLRGLEPDLLGEYLVWDTVKSPTDPLLITATGPEASEGQAQTALTVLNRLAARKPDAVDWLRTILDREFERLAVPAFRVALEQPLPMAALFREVMGRLTVEHALKLARLLPEYTTELCEIAALVEQRLVEVPLPADAPLEALLFKAGHLNNLSIRLSNLGQLELALAAVEEAVAIQRAVAQKQPDSFMPDLAMGLNTLSNRLSELGQRERALAAVEEAVVIRRALVKKRPDAFMHDLATALSSLANRLSDLGEASQALAAAKEAVSIRRILAERQPDAFMPSLALALNNMAIHLKSHGQPEQSLAAAEEAVTIYRPLTEKRRDAFLPSLAAALNTLAIRLSELGQFDKALATAEEAVVIYRALAEERPSAFKHELAMSLSNLSAHRSNQGQGKQAMTAIEEAVAIYRALFELRPDAFAHNLAASIAFLRNSLHESERYDDALAAAREALALQFSLFVRLPAPFGQYTTLFYWDYIESAQSAGQEPDPVLVDPIVAALVEHGFLPSPKAEPGAPSPT